MGSEMCIRDSSKAAKAEELGVPVLDEEGFARLLASGEP